MTVEDKKKSTVVAKDLLPNPVLAIGVTGHRDILDSEHLRDRVQVVLVALQKGLIEVVQRNPELFSKSAPVVRVCSMAAQGADLLVSEVAGRRGCEISCVVPFTLTDYRSDFTDECRARFDDLVSKASSVLQLSGTREEGPRAYERANDVVLEGIDLLLALWGGDRARGRAGTAEVVQRAVVRNIPVIVIEPPVTTPAKVLEAPNDENLAAPRASDLRKKELPGDLTRMVERLVGPPRNEASRTALLDLVAEDILKRSWRFEYRLLLDILAARKQPSASVHARPLEASAGLLHDDAKVAELSSLQHFVDGAAVRYGQLFRSSSVSRYLLVLAGSLIGGLTSLLFHELSGVGIAIQAVANGLVIADAAAGSRWRWQERWLEYRVVAQRLRWIAILRPLAILPGLNREGRFDTTSSWANWYVHRLGIAAGLQSGVVTPDYLAACAERIQTYVRQQIDYHRTNLRRLAGLEQRLKIISIMSLMLALLVAVALGLAAYYYGGFKALGWMPVAVSVLTLLPAVMTAMNGVRAELDLIRLIERSAQTSVLLSRVSRALDNGPASYDRLSVAAYRLTSIMDDELREWRFVLESRRSRLGLQRPSALKRCWRKYRGVSELK